MSDNFKQIDKIDKVVVCPKEKTRKYTWLTYEEKRVHIYTHVCMHTQQTEEIM